MILSRMLGGSLAILLPVGLWAEPTAVHLMADTDWAAAENGSEDGTVLTADNRYCTLYLKDSATLTGPLTITSGGFALQRSGCAETEVDLGSVLTANSVTLGSLFYFGGRESETGCALQKYAIGSGFALNFTGDLSANRDHGLLKVQNADVCVTGGTVSIQHLRLRTGKWTQADGKTVAAISTVIGRGAAEKYAENRQELEVSGGRYEFRRAAIGLGNSRNLPARLTVSGGTMESIYDGKAFNGSDYYAAGLDLAPQGLANENENDGQGNSSKPSRESPYCTADVLVSGGVLKTPRITFGGNGNLSYGGVWVDDTRASARVRVTGGTLNLGSSNIETGERWNAGETKDCRYFVEFSGGEVTTFEPGVAQTVEVRLTEDNGGVTYNIPGGSTYAVKAPMYGPGGFTKSGSGLLVFTGNNEYTGTTRIEQGGVYLRSVAGSPIAMFDAMALDLAADDDVTLWKNGKYSFTSELGATICGATTAPKMGSMNGQCAVAFGGTTALGITGIDPTPLSQKKSFTIGFVFCTDKDWAGGGSSSNWTECAYLAGQNIHNNTDFPNSRGWGVSIDKDGHVLAGSSFNYNNTQVHDPYTLKNDQVTVNDGNPHVVYYSWSNVTNHVLSVDGQVVRGSDTHEDWTNGINKTRFTIGGQDTPSNPKYFKGKMAFVGFFPVLSEADVATVTKSTAAFYDIDVGETEAESPTPATVEVADYPTATTTMTADSLSGAAGSSVAQWGVFKSSTAQAVFTANHGALATAPTITTNGFNGHKAVAFNGVSQAMACGGADAPFMESGSVKVTSNAFTVAAVLRFNGTFSRNFIPPAASVSNRHWVDEYHFLGTTQNGNFVNDNQYIWGLSCTGSGEAIAGVSALKGVAQNRDALGFSKSVGSENRWLVDDRPHVVVMTIPQSKNEGGVISLTVDGVRTEVTAPLQDALNGFGRSFVVLGGSCVASTNRYVGCAISEMRFWRGTELSAGQIRKLTEELCATYGADFRADERLGTVGQRSSVVDVAAGASYGCEAPYQSAALYEGQTLCGAGTVKGRFILKSGSTVALGATTPAFESVKFEDGAVLKVTDADGARLNAPGGISLKSGTVTLDLSDVAEVQELNREVLALGASGLTVSDFAISPASLANKMKLVVQDGVLRCKRNTGVVVIIR